MNVIREGPLETNIDVADCQWVESFMKICGVVNVDLPMPDFSHVRVLTLPNLVMQAARIVTASASETMVSIYAQQAKAPNDKRPRYCFISCIP